MRSFALKCFFAVIPVLFAALPLNAMVDLTNGWQYQWGPAGITGPVKNAWTNTASPYNIPGGNADSLLWLRIKLPSGDWKEPVIHLSGIDQEFQVSIDNQTIYHYGNQTDMLAGFSGHFIPLPDTYPGKEIVFRIHSSLDTIGFTDPRVELGNRSEIVLGLFQRDIDKLILGFIIITIGLATMVLFFTRIGQTAFLSLGFLNTLLGIYIIAQTRVKQILFGGNHTVWGVMELISLYLLPVIANTFAKEILKTRKNNPVYWAWVLSVIFAVSISALSFVNANFLLLVLPIFKICILVNILLIFAASAAASIKGNLNAKIFTAGFTVLAIFGIINIFQELRIIVKGVYLTHWGVFLFILILSFILVNQVITMYKQLKSYSDQLEEKNIVVGQTVNQLEKLYNEIELTQREVILRLSEITEARSKETGNHVRRVAEYSRILAQAAGLPQSEVDIIKLAAPMHDIGKLAIPDTILMKPGKLTSGEFNIIKTHTITGYEMLNKSKRDIFTAAAIIAYEHHEKYDGSGYPRKLKGKNIHIYGRITAIADVFDSLVSDRCYKKAWPMDQVQEYMKRNRDIHFDPDLIRALFDNIDVFIKIGEQYKDDYTGENPSEIPTVV